jgi:hypothetical protein
MAYWNTSVFEFVAYFDVDEASAGIEQDLVSLAICSYFAGKTSTAHMRQIQG